MSWGEIRTRGAGTSYQIEVAHEILNGLHVPGGILAERVVALVAAVERMPEETVDVIRKEFDLQRELRSRGNWVEPDSKGG